MIQILGVIIIVASIGFFSFLWGELFLIPGIFTLCLIALGFFISKKHRTLATVFFSFASFVFVLPFIFLLCISFF